MPLSTGQTEEFLYQAVLDRLIEVRADGTIWRIATERRNRWNAAVTRTSVEPHRIDGAMSNGYRMVKIMRNKKQVTTMAHRLVYRVFYGPIPPGLTVNHRNETGDRSDNRPENLEVATYAEQTRHAIEVLGRMPKDQDGEKNDMAKLTAAAVREIRRRRKAKEKLKSIAKDFGISDRQVSKIALGQRWKFLG